MWARVRVRQKTTRRRSWTLPRARRWHSACDCRLLLGDGQRGARRSEHRGGSSPGPRAPWRSRRCAVAEAAVLGVNRSTVGRIVARHDVPHLAAIDPIISRPVTTKVIDMLTTLLASRHGAQPGRWRRGWNCFTRDPRQLSDRAPLIRWFERSSSKDAGRPTPSRSSTSSSAPSLRSVQPWSAGEGDLVVDPPPVALGPAMGARVTTGLMRPATSTIGCDDIKDGLERVTEGRSPGDPSPSSSTGAQGGGLRRGASDGGPGSVCDRVESAR